MMIQKQRQLRQGVPPAKVRQLRDDIRLALMELADLAQIQLECGWEPGDPFVPNLLVTLPRLAVAQMLQLLSAAPPEHRRKLAGLVIDSLVSATELFHRAAKEQPANFSPAARIRSLWPSLRGPPIKSLRKLNEEYERLLETITLGADLTVEFGNIRTTGKAIKPQSVAVSETLERLKIIEARRRQAVEFEMRRQEGVAKLSDELADGLAAHLAKGLKLPKQARKRAKIQRARLEGFRAWMGEPQFPEASLPPLSRNEESQRIWWNHVKKFLEQDRVFLLNSRGLQRYREAGHEACKSAKSTSAAKPDTKAWHFFLSDCRKALRNLARTDGAR